MRLFFKSSLLVEAVLSYAPVALENDAENATADRHLLRMRTSICQVLPRECGSDSSLVYRLFVGTR